MIISRSTGQNKRWVLAIISAALFTAGLSQPALSASTGKVSASPALDACISRSGGVTSDMRACLASEYGRLDTNLNKTYKKIMGQLRTKDLRTRLVHSQRVWIWRRDDQCRSKVEASGMSGGTAADLIYDDCRNKLVRDRIIWLNKVPKNPGYLTKV